MLVVTVEFLHGMVRAASADDTPLTGQASTGEWPPSPARLFQAFVAADGTGERRRVTAGEQALSLLEAPPLIHAIARRDVTSSELVPRYVVIDESKGSGVQNYAARQAKEIRPGARLSLREPKLAYVWADADPSDQDIQDLAFRPRARAVLGLCGFAGAGAGGYRGSTVG